MSPTLLTLTLAALLPAAEPEKSASSAKSSNLGFATKEEDDAFDAVIDQFLRVQTGALKGEDAETAQAEFAKLPPKALFALVRGLNRTADYPSTKPATALAPKLADVIRETNDPLLLEFARDNIGFREKKKVERKSSDEQEAKFDVVIDRFIQYDLGKLRGAEGLAAKAAFERLPSDAVFALIRGLNRAAAFDQSCPANVIGKRLVALLGDTRDPALLDNAIDNVGTRGPWPRHMSVINNVTQIALNRKKVVAPPKPRGLSRELVEHLKGLCQARMADIASGGRSGETATPDPKRFLVFKPSGKKTNGEEKTPTSEKSPGVLGQMSVTELSRAAESAQGAKRKEYFVEIEKRSGDSVVAALAKAYRNDEDRKLAGDLLVSYFSRQDAAYLKKQLADERTTVRLAAVKAAGKKELRLGGEVIGLLNDGQPQVREAAHSVLVQLAGVDYGPTDVSVASRNTAVLRWRAWWAKQR